MATGVGSKENIFENLKDVIAAIPGIAVVDRQFNSPPDGNYDYPSVYINDRDEVRERLLKDLFKSTLEVGLVLIVTDVADGSQPQEVLSTTINAFIEQIITAVLTDITRDGEADDTRITTIVVDPANINPPEAAVGVVVEIDYFRSS